MYLLLMKFLVVLELLEKKAQRYNAIWEVYLMRIDESCRPRLLHRYNTEGHHSVRHPLKC